jgi:hypothetical protein
VSTATVRRYPYIRYPRADELDYDTRAAAALVDAERNFRRLGEKIVGEPVVIHREIGEAHAARPRTVVWALVVSDDVPDWAIGEVEQREGPLRKGEVIEWNP